MWVSGYFLPSWVQFVRWRTDSCHVGYRVWWWTAKSRSGTWQQFLLSWLMQFTVYSLFPRSSVGANNAVILNCGTRVASVWASVFIEGWSVLVVVHVDGVRLRLNSGHWVYCSFPDDIRVWRGTVEWHWQGIEELGENLSQFHFIHHKSHMGANRGLCGKRPATNRLSHGTAKGFKC
jgi:hypothetical protein